MNPLWTLALPAVGALGLTAFNLLFWPRGHAAAHWPGSVTVLIPARNEAANIEACVRSVFASGIPLRECIVCDDGSTDDTPAILARLQTEFSQLRVIQGIGLPAGWVGKPHACHRLSQHADADWLLFLDADVRLLAGQGGRLADVVRRYDAEVLTAVPRQQMRTFAEQLLIPLLHVTYVSWLPLPLIWRTHDPRFLAAMGQVLLVRRSTYDRIGGFEAVRTELVDDMAFCRNAKRNRARVVFMDGHEAAVCRMYDSAQAIWEGFSKNLYEGIGHHPAALALVVALYSATFILPWVWLALGLALGVSALWMAGAVGIAAGMAQRGLLTWRMGHPAWSFLAPAVSTMGFLGIAINSWRWSRAGAIRWSGRVYAARTARTSEAA